MKQRRPQRGSPPGPRPHTWITGTDPVRHVQYDAWLKSRAQAAYRGESWDLPFEVWEQIWGTNWHRRGRGLDDLQMMRDDWDLPWHESNVILVDRREFYRRQGIRKRYLNTIRKGKK